MVFESKLESMAGDCSRESIACDEIMSGHRSTTQLFRSTELVDPTLLVVHDGIKFSTSTGCAVIICISVPKGTHGVRWLAFFLGQVAKGIAKQC